MNPTSRLVMCLAAALVAGACSSELSSPGTSVADTTPAPVEAPAPLVTPAVTAVAVRDGQIIVEGRDVSPGVVVNVFQQQDAAAVNLGGVTPDGQPRILVTHSSPGTLTFPVPPGLRAGAFYVQLVNPPFRPETTSRDEPAARATLAR